MKKTKEILFILSVLCIALMLFGCDSGGGGGAYKKSTLTLQNCPAGDLSVLVYSSNTLPTTRTEYNDMASHGKTIAAAAYQSSPITLGWVGSIESGTRLVSVVNSSTNEIRFGLAQFDSKGNASINWNIMTDLFSLPY